VGLQADRGGRSARRSEGLKVTNKQVYRVFKAFGLLQKKRVREAALYQAARLFELLPAAANDLWQADVTYLHSSFLARHFQKHIKDRFAHVRIQYRTPSQLGLLERFHQTLKTEEVYWKLYASPAEARESLEVFRRRYNEIRPHWALEPAGGGDVLTPADVYVQGQAIELPKWQGWAKAAREKLKELARGARLPEMGDRAPGLAVAA
jgi:transposase InsO family protein